MKIKRQGSAHRAVMLPVLLVLAASFLATSLGSVGGNDITGAQTMGSGRCSWNSSLGNYGSTIVYCPTKTPKIVAGGCGSGVSYNALSVSQPVFTSPNSWNCTASQPQPPGGLQGWAYCCR
tara:strand:- start:2322 stop:2684 length:363 start_codon:yes stop_codon:yes gene_type:complete